MKVSGALCLMSDLTELTALQKQMRWKENLAALEKGLINLERHVDNVQNVYGIPCVVSSFVIDV